VNGETPNSETVQAAVLEDFNKFMRNAYQSKSRNGESYKQYVEERRSNLDFWLQEGGCMHPYLKTVATRLFSLIASTGGVERANSTMGFIHNKLRNSLGEAKVTKIVYIKSNFTLLDKKNNVASASQETTRQADAEELDEEDAMNTSLADLSFDGNKGADSDED
jgi:hypothetical protein